MEWCMPSYKYAIIRACKYASIKVYVCMQLGKNKGMCHVCMQFCKYLDIEELKYKLN